MQESPCVESAKTALGQDPKVICTPCRSEEVKLSEGAEPRSQAAGPGRRFSYVPSQQGIREKAGNVVPGQKATCP